MNYQSKNRRGAGQNTSRFVFPTIIFIILLGLLTFTPHFSRTFAQYIGTPIRKSTTYLSDSLANVQVFFYSKTYLVQENLSLERELYTVNLQVVDRNSLETENQVLKTLMGRTSTRKSILVAVLSRPSETPYDTVIIDGGSSVGLKVGEIVQAGNEDLGYITTLFPNSAEVTLYSSSGEKNQVEIGANHVKAEADGQSGDTSIVTLPRDVLINVGDSVIDPDLSGDLLGTVSYIGQNANNPFQTIYFSNSINLNLLRYLTVITS